MRVLLSQPRIVCRIGDCEGVRLSVTVFKAFAALSKGGWPSYLHTPVLGDITIRDGSGMLDT